MIQIAHVLIVNFITLQEMAIQSRPSAHIPWKLQFVNMTITVNAQIVSIFIRVAAKVNLQVLMPVKRNLIPIGFRIIWQKLRIFQQKSKQKVALEEKRTIEEQGRRWGGRGGGRRGEGRRKTSEEEEEDDERRKRRGGGGRR